MAVRFMQGMSMVELFLRLIINAALLMFVSRLVPGLYVEGWGAAFVGAIVLGLVNFFVKPVMVVLTFPFTILTFGLFLLVLNALMLWLVSGVVPGIHLRGFGSAFIGSLLFSLLNMAISAIVRR